MDFLRERCEYETKSWVYYRYFSLNPNAITEEYAEYYKALDKYFMDKYNIGDVKSTREGIREIFAFPSERPAIISDATIRLAIAEYKAKPYLLATKDEWTDAITEAMFGIKPQK